MSAVRAEAAPAELIALVASAGGLGALTAVLRALPADLPAAVVVAQHLGGQGSKLVQILGRRVALPVVWARSGEPVVAGQVTVCPPRAQLEVLPDWTCAVTPEGAARDDRPFDVLLTSLAESVGSRAAGVVMTGMGNDGARGALALHEAGGLVIAQDDATAEHPQMPQAAAATGAVSAVLPLFEIGPAIVAAAHGRQLPVAPTEVRAIRDVFGPDGAMAAIAAGVDWSRTPLGPVSGWPPVLRSILRLMMACPDAVAVVWGDELLFFFNDAAVPIISGRERTAFGRPYKECWPDLWEQALPDFQHALSGRSTHFPVARFRFERDGRVVDVWADYADTPIWDDNGAVGGIQRTFSERTTEVLAARRLATLNALGAAPRGAGRRDALAAGLDVLREADDVPFAVGYLLDPQAARAGLVGAVGVDAGGPMAPRDLRLGPSAPWPLHDVVAAGRSVTVDDLAARFRGHLVGEAQITPESALLHPLRDGAHDRVTGVLVLGADPYLVLDERYREFLALAGNTVAARMAESHARQRERQRLERLAELDRAKTEFFSNVSHEFRTPLTLMLGPLDAVLERSDLPADVARELDVVRRNARRLLRLTGALLDVSQMEAGRLRARFSPEDLAERTRDVLAQFEAAVSRAGLELRTAVEPLGEPVWVDAEMWEKIVANLLSNALKFTFSGEIEVTLRALPKHAELVVRDTGVGIPAEELPYIFKRFHRVRGARARTHEGAGIGLALVDELVRRHHGRVRATSALGAGTTFTVWLPFGPQSSRDAAEPGPPPGAPVAAAMAEEAAHWDREPGLMTDRSSPEALEAAALRVRAPGARVLVVDDNPDMRDYLTRLLRRQWTVSVAADGERALELARREAPDLVVADVMMPGLDGFELLKRLRDDARLRTTPVVLVTARAGEESAIEGLLAGADDYIVKPFSARELVARVGGQLELARARRRATELNAFRIGLSDALRTLSDPLEIQRTACRMLLEQLGTDRARFVELDAANGEFITMGGHARPPMPGGYGHYAMDAYAPLARAILAGRRLVIENTQTDPYVRDIRESLAQLQIGAHLVLPLVRDGGSTVALAVHHREPRPWTAEEIAIAEEAAGRAWAEVERARAEAALRESEERFRALAQRQGSDRVV